ncbi:MAG: transcription antitermination factor NusB [Clostridia bacterium]|nr:transcription antitermination factor NusB [Clostridia bacterium]
MAVKKESGKFRVRPERELAFIVIFESLFRGPDDTAALFDSIMESDDADGIYSDIVSGQEKLDLDYVRSALFGVRDNSEEIKKLIAAHAKGWKFERMSKVSLAVLELALWEIRFSGGAVHPGTAINEAVELAKIYDDDKAPGFVNGILGAVVREPGDK